MPAIIEIIGLKKVYEAGDVQVQALRGVSFSIKAGEFVAIMGASGSGKSTLMNLLGCLDRPSGGRYVLDGVDVADLDEPALAAIRSTKIGFVFQNFNLLSRTSALENVELPLFYSSFSAEGAGRAAELLRMVGLGGREGSMPNQLSGGQQQRVAIARALVNDPRILLADEPTGNLDSQNSGEIMQLLARLNRDHGLTVVVVTHDPDIAAYADRTITFRDGRIVSDHRRAAADKASAAQSAADAGRSGGIEEAWSFGAMALTAAARALRRNKMRAVLTMLGIFIGVAAVIAMIAIGNGARYSVQQQLASLGTNIIVVLPGATTSNGVRAGMGSVSTLTVADADAVKKEDSAVARVSYFDRQIAQVVGNGQNWSTSINGTTPAYFAIRDWPAAVGRLFDESEAQSAANVCVLGQTVAHNLFGDQNPVGAVVRIKGFPLRVIGVLTAKGQSTWGQDQDDVIAIPFLTAERKVLGNAQVSAQTKPSPSPTPGPGNNPVINPYASVPTTNSIYSNNTSLISPFGAPLEMSGLVNMLYIQAKSAALVDTAVAQITRTLHQRHQIERGQDNDFTVRSLNEIAQASESASRVMTLLLAAVASISLLVGGIGIMNIMLVSVTERTREIGIRMAIGARRFQILMQFLVEALLLSVIGGVAGAILGIATSEFISAVAQWPTLISPASVVGGFLFAAAVGIFFGYYPARKASMLDPIEALRYE